MSKLMEAAGSRRDSTPTDLDDRITAAFADGAKSDDIASLIVEAEAAAIAAGDTAELARSRALDPALSAPDVAKARAEMENAAFRRDRLEVAVTKLRERLKAVKAQEEDSRRQVAYAKAITVRDELAKELREVYPALATQLADLMVRITASDREIEHINAHALPAQAERLLVAELVARELEGFVRNSIQTPRITEELRIPAFRFDRHDAYAWPPREASPAVLGIVPAPKMKRDNAA
jgi:hypothetical protein